MQYSVILTIFAGQTRVASSTANARHLFCHRRRLLLVLMLVVLGNSRSSAQTLTNPNPTSGFNFAAEPASDDPAPKRKVTAADFLANHTSASRGSRRSRFFPIGNSSGELQLAFVVNNSVSLNEEIHALQQEFRSILESQFGAKKRDLELEIKGNSVYRVNGNFILGGQETLSRWHATESLSRQIENIDQDASQSSVNLYHGIARALARLNWDTDTTSTRRWIVVITNSSRLLSSMDDKTNRAYIEQIINRANQDNIAVHCLLCRDSAALDEVRKRTRQFLGELCLNTGGHFVDLENDHSLQYWNGKSTEIEQFSFDPSLRGAKITVNEEINSGNASAVLQTKLFAGTMKQLVDQVPGFVFSRANPEFEIRIAPSETAQQVSVQLLRHGKLVSELKVASRQGDLFRQSVDCLNRLLARTQESTPVEPLNSHWTRYQDQLQTASVNVCQETRAREHVESAMLKLQASHDFKGARLKRLLKDALADLVNADVYDSENPFLRLLMARCFFNLSQDANDHGNQAEKKYYQLRYLAFLDDAKVRSHALPADSVIRLEIHAEHALMDDLDIATAIRCYQQLAAHPWSQNSGFGQRAHWMLAGIRAGDWDVSNLDSTFVDPGLAKMHLETIVTRWPDSSYSRHINAQLERAKRNAQPKFTLPIGDQSMLVNF